MTDNMELIRRRVREQYEKYPYPDIDPAGARPQLLVSGHLSLMCDILWGGKKPPERLRVLDAGCGTGGPMVAMALKYPDTHIVGVDFSEASLDKARQLAQRLGVRNVEFHHLAIEELPKLGQVFDFVVSSGVLHHLPDPARGLKAIGDVLDPQGAISVMLYGLYGRVGIYMLQEALHRLYPPGNNEAEKDMREKISGALALARSVPSFHPMSKRARGRELQEGKASGVVDLLLHANDIPFDVPSVYRMCEDAGMRFYRWLFPLIYEPSNYFKDSLLLESIQGLSPRRRHEAAELVHGGNSKHSFFVVGPDFKPVAADISNGKWRKLHGKLTPCLAWNRTAAVPGGKNRFAVPPAIVQDAWGPMELAQWELTFLSHILPEHPLGQVVQMPAVRKLIPFQARKAVDRGIEKLLARVLDNLGIVLLEP